VAMTGNLRPVRDGLRPARGSIRLLMMRVFIVVLSSLPALILGALGVASGAARRPYYTEVDGRLPLMHFIRLMRELPGSFVPAAILGVVLAVLADQLLTGGALVVLDPARPVGERPKVFAAVFRDGLTHIWAFLRAVFAGVVLSAAGAALLGRLFNKLNITAYHAGWTAQTALLRLPMLAVISFLVWFATVGAWVFWCRLLTVADGRRRVRRTGVLVLRVFARHPLRSWALFVGLTASSTLASAAVLVAWRQAEPKTGAGAAGWAILWLITLLLQAFVWLWLLRAGRLLYASEGLADLRSKPDDPFGLFGRLVRLVRRRSRKAASREPASGAPEARAPE
jgi:hypothetical protein